MAPQDERLFHVQSRSTIVTFAWPPPSHIVWRPYFPPVASSTPSKVAISLVPLAPSGWPSAIAPPWTLSRSEEHTSELQSLMRISYAVFCLKKNNIISYKKITQLTKQNKII